MKHNIIFFTGAGISVESGIPTFEEQPGIRDKLTRDFANGRPEEYWKTILGMMDACEKAQPNAAHIAIAELGCPVITMNVDQLHTKAGSKNVIEVHGVLPNPVLYGDIAPKYEDADNMIGNMEIGNSILVIVGTSFYTSIAHRIRMHAYLRGVTVLTINSDAATRVPELCEVLKGIDWDTVKLLDMDFSKWED